MTQLDRRAAFSAIDSLSGSRGHAVIVTTRRRLNRSISKLTSCTEALDAFTNVPHAVEIRTRYDGTLPLADTPRIACIRGLRRDIAALNRSINTLSRRLHSVEYSMRTVLIEQYHISPSTSSERKDLMRWIRQKTA